jgi:hypothetical protein
MKVFNLNTCMKANAANAANRIVQKNNSKNTQYLKFNKYDPTKIST